MNIEQRIAPLVGNYSRSHPLPRGKKTALIILIACCSVFVGCERYHEWRKNRQLARVAKDWSLTIRASQVIPVYPMSADVQPGDVLLVDHPIEEDIKRFNGKGFLDIQNVVTRLQPTNYPEFYERSYFTGTNTDYAGTNSTIYHVEFPEKNRVRKINAPPAGFPTYSFTVKSGAGVNAAFPISGIPVGLKLLSTQNASCSVSLGGAYTYGLDEETLREQLLAWVKATTNANQYIASDPTKTNYFRVVNRVYLVGDVDIDIANSSASGAGVSGGAAPASPLASLESTNALTYYTNLLNSLNVSLSNVTTQAGGSLQVAAFSTRAISMHQHFPQPLVIGYLAYDVPIHKDRITNIVNGVTNVSFASPMSIRLGPHRSLRGQLFPK